MTVEIVCHREKTLLMAKEHATVLKVGWVKLVRNHVSMAQQPLIFSVSVNLVTMAATVLHSVLTRPVFVTMPESVTVDLRDGEENFVKKEDAQG